MSSFRCKSSRMAIWALARCIYLSCEEVCLVNALRACFPRCASRAPSVRRSRAYARAGRAETKSCGRRPTGSRSLRSQRSQRGHRAPAARAQSPSRAIRAQSEQATRRRPPSGRRTTPHTAVVARRQRPPLSPGPSGVGQVDRSVADAATQRDSARQQQADKLPQAQILAPPHNKRLVSALGHESGNPHHRPGIMKPPCRSAPRGQRQAYAAL